MKPIRIFAFAGAVLLAALPQPGPASEYTAVMATIHQFVDAFNRGDAKAEAAACDAQAAIIDDFAPHEWQGPTACADWAAAYAADAQKDGATDGVVTLGRPWYSSVTGNRAYVVLPATFSWKERGKPVTESGSIFTVVLRKSSAGWRITGWAWSKH